VKSRLLGARLVTLVVGLAALTFSAAFAGATAVVNANIQCSFVTFEVIGFPPVRNNTIHETVSVDGSQVADLTVTFDGPNNSNTVPISLTPGTHTIAAHADWSTTCGACGAYDVTKVVSCGSSHPPCTVVGSINSNFNGTAVVGASSGPAFIWFNSNISVKGMTAGNSIFLTGSRVFINGAPYDVPNARITFETVSCATTLFDAGTNTWITTVPLAGSDEIFLSGFAFPVTNLPGGATVRWEGTFGTDQSGVCLSWKWGAAAYTTFGDYNAAQIKPTHQSSCLINNGDHAGTPQNTTVRASVTGGARGGGGSNFTGSWSATGALCPVCPPCGCPLAQRLVNSGGSYLDATQSAAIPRVLSLSAPSPSPSHGTVRFVVGVPSEGNLRLRVFDVRGRLVATVTDHHEGIGWPELTWDGRGESGKPAPGGIYFAKVELSGQSVTRKFIVAR